MAEMLDNTNALSYNYHATREEMMAYNPIPYQILAKSLEKIGAKVLPFGTISGTFEAVFDLPVRSKSGQTFPYIVRIYSAVEQSLLESRNCGKDSIKVYLILDNEDKYNNNVKIWERSKRIHRSGTNEDIIDRIIQRCREMYRLALDPYYHCPKCGGYMVVRHERKTGKAFRGCCNYPNCKHTDNNVLPEDNYDPSDIK